MTLLNRLSNVTGREAMVLFAQLICNMQLFQAVIRQLIMFLTYHKITKDGKDLQDHPVQLSTYYQYFLSISH